MHKHDIPRALTSFSGYEVRKILTQGRPMIHSVDLDVKVLPTKQSFGKILIITPKKIGSAPKRNLLKRRLKSLFYEKKYYTVGYDIALYCKKGSTLLSFAQLAAYLETLFNQLAPP